MLKLTVIAAIISLALMDAFLITAVIIMEGERKRDRK